MGIASPYRAGAQFGSYPLRAGRSRGVVQGAKRPAGALCSRVRSAALPIPGHGITASRWRFGMVSRCSAYGATRPAENLGPGGVKSVEAVPRPWLTFNLVQKHRGGHKIGPRSAGYPFPGSLNIRRPENPLKFQLQGFSLCGAANQFRDYVAIYSIAKSVIQPSEKAPAMGAF